MSLITKGDFIDTAYKIRERGWNYIFSKFGSAGKRVVGTFNDSGIRRSDWWMIPAVRERWNYLTSGDPATGYEEYTAREYLKGKTGLTLFSPGCGNGNHEIRFAELAGFSSVTGIDLAPQLIAEANQKAAEKGLKQVRFMAADLFKNLPEKESVDVFLFNSSLHHFLDIGHFIPDVVLPAMRRNGILVLNEYAGASRFQWPDHQLQACNEMLNEIPQKYRAKLHGGIKKRVYRPGTLRMILSDPSESVDSAAILPAVHRHFNICCEHGLGGSLLMPVLKDIAHHFAANDPEANECLQEMFKKEDDYIKKYGSDFIFGVYTPK